MDDDRVPRERRIAPAVERLARRGLCHEVDLVVGATGDALDELSLADGTKHVVILERLDPLTTNLVALRAYLRDSGLTLG